MPAETTSDIELPKRSLSIFDNCPRGFEDELVTLMVSYAREAVIADRAKRTALPSAAVGGPDASR